MVPPIFINVPPVSDIFESIAHFLNEEGYRKYKSVQRKDMYGYMWTCI